MGKVSLLFARKGKKNVTKKSIKKRAEQKLQEGEKGKVERKEVEGKKKGRSLKRKKKLESDGKEKP